MQTSNFSYFSLHLTLILDRCSYRFLIHFGLGSIVGVAILEARWRGWPDSGHAPWLGGSSLVTQQGFHSQDSTARILNVYIFNKPCLGSRAGVILLSVLLQGIAMCKQIKDFQIGHGFRGGGLLTCSLVGRPWG